jgi:hypothetical protein
MHDKSRIFKIENGQECLKPRQRKIKASAKMAYLIPEKYHRIEGPLFQTFGRFLNIHHLQGLSSGMLKSIE